MLARLERINVDFCLYFGRCTATRDRLDGPAINCAQGALRWRRDQGAPAPAGSTQRPSVAVGVDVVPGRINIINYRSNYEHRRFWCNWQVSALAFMEP
jgi:hypothetical protein